jgi:uncharacterized protein YdeI (BOF family)
MKSIVEVLSLFLILVISLYSSAEAQNTTNGNNSNYTGGGLSTNSVDIAKSNVNDLIQEIKDMIIKDCKLLTIFYKELSGLIIIYIDIIK